MVTIPAPGGPAASLSGSTTPTTPLTGAPPIKPTSGVALAQTPITGVRRAQVIDPQEKVNLSWDRFARLSRSAKVLAGFGAVKRVLDVGGLDGALALFLPGSLTVDVVDPATTYGTGLDLPLPDKSYDAVVAIDCLEHISPEARVQFVRELCRVSALNCLISFPDPATLAAQQLVHQISHDPYVAEHIDLGLPSTQWVVKEMSEHGFSSVCVPNTSLAVWVTQFLLGRLDAEVGAQVNRFLVEHFPDEPFSKNLYQMVVGQRIR